MQMEIDPEVIAMQEEMQKAMAQNALNTLEKLALSANQTSREVSSYGLTRTDQLITTASSIEKNGAELMHRLELESMSCFRRVATTLSGFTKISETLKTDPTGETKAYLFEKLANISKYEYEVQTNCNTKEKYNLKAFGNEDIYAKLSDKVKAPKSELLIKVEATLNAVNSIAYSFQSAYENPEILIKMKEACEKIAKQTLSPQEELDKMAESLKALAPEYSTEQALNNIFQK